MTDEERRKGRDRARETQGETREVSKGTERTKGTRMVVCARNYEHLSLDRKIRVLVHEPDVTHQLTQPQ